MRPVGGASLVPVGFCAADVQQAEEEERGHGRGAGGADGAVSAHRAH